MEAEGTIVVEKRERTLSFLETLAEIASQSSPISAEKEGQDQDFAVGYENSGRGHFQRPRAYSEPWIKNEFSAIHEDKEKDKELNIITLPQMLEKYSSIYNKNGRIGIYTRDERNNIIRRFHDKRKRRVWKKKIRYHCRKNLADSRIRVKGRFVKSADTSKSGSSANQDSSARNTMNALLIASQLESEGSVESPRSTGETEQVEGTGGDAPSREEDEDNEEEEEEEDDEYDGESLRSTSPPSSASSGRNKRMRRHSIAY